VFDERSADLRKDRVASLPRVQIRTAQGSVGRYSRHSRCSRTAVLAVLADCGTRGTRGLRLTEGGSYSIMVRLRTCARNANAAERWGGEDVEVRQRTEPEHA
jgi:hypothetical protein